MKQHVLRSDAVNFQFVGELASRALDEQLEGAAGEKFATHHHPATAKP